MADAGIRAANLRQAYVSNSRFRESQVIYTSDFLEAGDAMARPGERKLVRELVAQPRSSTSIQPSREAAFQHPMLLKTAGQ